MKVLTRTIEPRIYCTDGDINRYMKRSLVLALQKFMNDYTEQYNDMLTQHEMFQRDFKNYRFTNTQDTAYKMCDAIYPYIRRYLALEDVAEVLKYLSFEVMLKVDKVVDDKHNAVLGFQLDVNGSDEHPFSDTLTGTIALYWAEEEYMECRVHHPAIKEGYGPDTYKVPYGENATSAIARVVEGNIFTYTNSCKRKYEVIAFTKYDEQIITEKKMLFSSFTTDGFKSHPVLEELEPEEEDA